ncbi:MAG TPA: hypothetical protein VFU23_00050 [Gemmatimonadales bacterium]|nr:hypothetical protein [Gemmatimonadales bacterium]
MTGPAGAELAELERRARRAVDAVADNPDGRLELRMAFYRKYGRGEELQKAGKLSPALPDAEFGYGRSELDFLRWEIRRGVLNPANGSRGTPGSTWWSRVDLAFLYYGQLAALLHEAGVPPNGAPVPVRRWLDFIEQPGEISWYRAHNTSIATGYQANRECAAAETRGEQTFMNVVLYRLLYAQGLVEGAELGLLGRLLANPRLPSVDALVHLPDFYPDHYPLDGADIRHILDRGHSLEELGVRILDEVLILPHLTHLYALAAKWVDLPVLPEWLNDGRPVYPLLAAPDSSTGFRAMVHRMARWIGLE